MPAALPRFLADYLLGQWDSEQLLLTDPIFRSLVFWTANPS